MFENSIFIALLLGGQNEKRRSINERLNVNTNINIDPFEYSLISIVSMNNNVHHIKQISSSFRYMPHEILNMANKLSNASHIESSHGYSVNREIISR